MIQFNLLPDVKLEYLKAEKTRRLVVSVSVLVTLAAVAILVLLLSVTALQRKHLADLNKDIKTERAKIEGHDDLNKILTVQNQLSSLTGLHSTKPAASRLPGYLGQVTPAQVNISNVDIDYALHTMTITGTADALSTVNQYVDTLKFTTYSAKEGESKPAFSSVVLGTFSLGEKEANYNLNLVFDPVIFDITQSVSLAVPSRVTTRSQVDKPTDLFKLPVDATSKPGTGR